MSVPNLNGLFRAAPLPRLNTRNERRFIVSVAATHVQIAPTSHNTFALA
jgi:hypothetical protein